MANWQRRHLGVLWWHRFYNLQTLSIGCSCHFGRLPEELTLDCLKSPANTTIPMGLSDNTAESIHIYEMPLNTTGVCVYIYNIARLLLLLGRATVQRKGIKSRLLRDHEMNQNGNRAWLNTRQSAFIGLPIWWGIGDGWGPIARQGCPCPSIAPCISFCVLEWSMPMRGIRPVQGGVYPTTCTQTERLPRIPFGTTRPHSDAHPRSRHRRSLIKRPNDCVFSLKWHLSNLSPIHYWLVWVVIIV